MLQNALIVLPLQSEFRFFTESLDSFGFAAKEICIGKIPVKAYAHQGLICAVGGHGKTQFGIQTQFLISQFPDISKVFCIGAAGGLANVKKFDVVIADETIEHDYTERFDPAPQPTFPGCRESIAYLRSKMPGLELPFAIHQGIIASGDEDVVAKERAEEIHEKTRALAVAWEGAGGARASAFNGKAYLEVRGITDLAGSSAAADFRDNLAQSMKNIALLLKYMVLQNQN